MAKEAQTPPVPELKTTLFPIQFWRFSPLASITLPVPSFPPVKGKDIGPYTP